MGAPKQTLSPLAAAAAAQRLTAAGIDLAERNAANMKSVTDLTGKLSALADSEEAKTPAAAAQSKVLKDALLGLRTEQYALREQMVLLDRAGEYAAPEADLLRRLTAEEHAELSGLLERIDARLRAEDSPPPPPPAPEPE